jgi:hypothetical protein
MGREIESEQEEENPGAGSGLFHRVLQIWTDVGEVNAACVVLDADASG